MTTNPLPPEAPRDPPGDQAGAEAAVGGPAAGRIVEQLAGWLTAAGLSRMAARVYLTLLLSPSGALTGGEISARLSVSPAAISKAVQALALRGAIHREYVPGSRRELYRVQESSWVELFGERTRWLRAFASALARSIDALGGEQHPAGARLAEMRDYLLDAAAQVDGLSERWKAGRAAPR